MNAACSTHERREKCAIFVGKLGAKIHLEGLSVDKDKGER
jgi:hypothetical protein